MIDPQDILSRVDALGTLPTSTTQLYGLLGDGEATLADYERVVVPDLSLTANLLRCANAPLIRAVREVTSAREAIHRLGVRRVTEIASGASFARVIPPRLPGYGMSASTFWRHSIAVAVLAERYGKAAGFAASGLAFTAGLLHDVGKLVFAVYLGSPAAGTLPADLVLDCVEAERALFGLDHCELGEALALAWRLPREVVASARWHHAPERAPAAYLRYLVAAVHAAEVVANENGYGDGHPVPPLDPSVLERLGLDEDGLARVYRAAELDLEKTLGLLSVLPEVPSGREMGAGAA